MEPFERRELKARAKATLKNYFWMACLVCLIGNLLGGGWNGLKQSKAPVNLTQVFSTSNFTSDLEDSIRSALKTDTDYTDDTDLSIHLEDYEATDTEDLTMEYFLEEFAKGIRESEKGQNFYYDYDYTLSEGDNLRKFMQALLNYYGITAEDIVGFILVMIGIILILFVVVWMISTIFRFLIGSFLGAPVGVGMRKYFLLSRTEKGTIDDVFSAFSGGHYLNVVKTMFSTNIRIFGWSLLFYFPGLVKYYQYYFVPYIMAEHPEMSPKEARDLSREMTDGCKWNIFLLELSFLGWVCLFVLEEIVLAIFSFGLLAIPGLLLIYPLVAYENATYAELYADRFQRVRKPAYTNIPDDSVFSQIM